MLNPLVHKTTIILKDDLVREAMAVTGIKGKTAVIPRGLMEMSFDTSVWIRHFRAPERNLVQHLEDGTRLAMAWKAIRQEKLNLVWLPQRFLRIKR